MSNLQDDIFDFVSLWKQSYSQKVPEIYNHSFSCSPFRERLTSSLSSLLRYARKDSKKRSSFTTSSPKREAVVKALPNLSRKKPTCWYPLTILLAMASHSATCKSCLMTGTLSSPLVHNSHKKSSKAQKVHQGKRRYYPARLRLFQTNRPWPR